MVHIAGVKPIFKVTISYFWGDVEYVIVKVSTTK